MDDLLCIANNRQVGVVRDHDDLPLFFGFGENGNEQTEHRLVVKILFRLIENDGGLSLVHQQVENQQKRATLARRQLLDLRVLEEQRVARLKEVQAKDEVIDSHGRLPLLQQAEYPGV
ncbi:hypothetical protein D9M68_915820 [compost metagenome]